MQQYVGLDVSQKETAVCVLDDSGKIEWRHVGYSERDHLGIPGWSWSGKAP